MASPYSTDLLVSFGSTLHVRNFVSTGVLTRLIAEGTSVSVVAPRAAAPFLRREVPGLTEIRALEHVALTPERQAVIHAMRLRAMIALREDPDYAVRMGLNARLGLRHAMATAKWLIQDHGRDGVAAATAVVEALPPSPAAVRMLQELSPGEVVWPTSIADAIDFEVIHAARSLGIPVTFFEGSWDNLTTKGPIWPRPDRVLVWGEYSRNQAVRHHGFSPEVIEVTGPPHFDIYGRDPALFDREAWCAANGLNPDLPIIFFAGTTQSKFVDEPIIVRQLSDWITQGKLPPATVWYRPHPKSLS